MCCFLHQLYLVVEFHCKRIDTFSFIHKAVCICHTYEYVNIFYIRVKLYASVTVTYVYECQMPNLTRVQTVRNLHVLSSCKEKSNSWIV